MGEVRASGEAVRRFLIANVEGHPTDVVRRAAEAFGCTRQAVHRHLRRLVAEGAVVESGRTRSKRYALAPLVRWNGRYGRTAELSEDAVWRADVAPRLGPLPENVSSIWHYGFTEMLNNAIDHSGARTVSVALVKTAATTNVDLYDDGVGIFKKIQAALGLEDERHAVLELAKGKLTTDPAHHSGEGIFFTSRVFDRFEILSGEVFFSHASGAREDWIHQTGASRGGTLVRMVLDNHTARTVKKVFDRFTSGDDYGFTKTVVPVRLLRYGDDNLVSRSQAKRLLSRFERFKVVILDFAGVASIGQSFADEVFRVFRGQHPEVALEVAHASSAVKRMISRAEAGGNNVA